MARGIWWGLAQKRGAGRGAWGGHAHVDGEMGVPVPLPGSAGARGGSHVRRERVRPLGRGWLRAEGDACA